MRSSLLFFILSLDLFLGAAQSGTWDVIKLQNTNGEFYNIDSHIPSNGPRNRYELQVVAIGLGMIEDGLSNDIKALETRITSLERRINSDLPLPPSVQHLKNQVDCFREKLETTESLSFLGKAFSRFTINLNFQTDLSHACTHQSH